MQDENYSVHYHHHYYRFRLRVSRHIAHELFPRMRMVNRLSSLIGLFSMYLKRWLCESSSLTDSSYKHFLDQWRKVYYVLLHGADKKTMSNLQEAGNCKGLSSRTYQIDLVYKELRTWSYQLNLPGFIRSVYAVCFWNASVHFRIGFLKVGFYLNSSEILRSLKKR